MHSDVLMHIIKDIEARNINLESCNFLDAGCGMPVMPNLFKILGCKHSIGLEYTELYAKVFSEVVKQGNILEYNFRDHDIIYSYNPIKNPLLMDKGLVRMKKTMKPGAILYFVSAQSHQKEVVLDMYRMKGCYNVLVYEKPKKKATKHSPLGTQLKKNNT